MRQKRPFPKFFTLILVAVLGVVLFQYQSFRTKAHIEMGDSQTNRLSEVLLQDAIPTIDKPKFESVSVADQYLNNNGLGIAVSVNATSRFYPYQIMVWHHLVNDVVGSESLLVSYNPFAMSGAVYQRSVQGIVYDFGLSDQLVNSAVLLYDRQTHSLWDPMTHRSIEGEKNGLVLARYPSSVLSWNAYKTLHADGQVLSRETGFSRDYTHDPYGDYEYNASILFPVGYKDDRLTAKERIYGIEWNQKQKAYPLSVLKKQLAIQDVLGNTSISVEYNEKTGVVHAYQLDAAKNHQAEIPVSESFWFAWANAFPQTDLFKL